MLKWIVAGLIAIAVAAVSPITATAASDTEENAAGYTAVCDTVTE